MIIYIVAGERNCKQGAVSDNGGLWANVGQTERNPQVRLLDDDYRKKAAGGKWLVLAEFDVGDSLTDHDVHRYLKSHAEVKWDYTSNTEEFLFTTDDGTGREAERIVREFVEVNCIPMLQDKLFELQQVVEELQAGKTEAENKLHEYMETDEGKLKAECYSLLEKANEEYNSKIHDLEIEELNLKKSLDLHKDKLDEEYTHKLQDLENDRRKVKRVLRLRQDQLDQKEQQVINHRESLKEREAVVVQAETQQRDKEAKLREREWFLESEHNKRETKINWGIIATSVLITFMITKCSTSDRHQVNKINQLKKQLVTISDKYAEDNKQLQETEAKLKLSTDRVQALEKIVEEKVKLINGLNNSLASATSAEKQEANKNPKIRTVKVPEVIIKEVVKEVPKEIIKEVVKEVPKVVIKEVPVTVPQSYDRSELSVCMQSCKIDRSQCYQAVTGGEPYLKNGRRITGYQDGCDSYLKECQKNCKVQAGQE